MKFLKMASLLSLIALPTIALAGGDSSAGGGGVIVFQAKAIESFLESSEFQSKFSGKPTYINSIERLSWANGITHYKITTDGPCTLLVDTIAVDDARGGSGVTFQIKMGEPACL